jgi:hypothetical protein
MADRIQARAMRRCEESIQFGSSLRAVFAYDSRTRTFIANGMKGRHLSSNDALVKNGDGSTDIYIGPTVPKDLETNWIETIPGTEIFIGLRTYGPEDTVLDGTYKIPRFELVD